MRILDYLKQRSVDNTDKTFVADLLRSVTYGQFYELVLHKANGLYETGVRTEDRVLLVIEHGIDHLISYFACMHIGAIPVNLSISKPAKGIIQAAEITLAKYCITQNYPEDLSEAQFNVLPFETISSQTPCKENTECSIAYMMFTSGTTGAPKAVITSHANTIATASSILDFAKIQSTDKELISLPLAFTFGLGHIHALIMVAGEAYLTNRRYDIGYLAQTIKTENATGFLASPAMLREMVADHSEALKEAGKHLQYVVVNCTPMEVALTKKLLQLLPDTQLYMYYGMTEASRCAFIHYNDNLHRLDFTGKHTLNTELKIDEPDEKGIGEICMRGPNVMPGYWNNTKATEETIDQDGWIHSGDFGIMDDDGYVKVIGRMNDQISVDGMKCQPAEVEAIIEQLPFVEKVTVCGLPDTQKFQIVAAAIVTTDDMTSEYLFQTVQDHCRKKLEAFKVPVVIQEMQSIPANELGKVNRKKLIELLTQQVITQ